MHAFAKTAVTMEGSLSLGAWQVVDAAISESVFNMLEGCVPEFTEQGYDRPPSGSTISGGLLSAIRGGP